MFKRITSLFLAVALLISMVPAQALAVETEPVETTETAAPAETQAPTALSGETEPVETQWTETTAVTETAAPDEETEPPVTTEPEIPETTASLETEPEVTEEVQQVTEPALAETETNTGTCGENLTWTLDDTGCLTISGTGAMTDYTGSSAMPWYALRESILSIVVASGVTSVGNYAFYNCYNVETVALPEGLERIGNYAFQKCTKLTGVSMPDTVTGLGKACFSGCTALAEVKLSAGWTECISQNTSTGVDYQGSVFNGCTALKEITVPEGVTGLPNYAFNKCNYLEIVHLPSTLTEIGTAAFYDCAKLQTVTGLETVTLLGESVFYGCKALTGVTLGEGLVDLPYRTFYNCTNLTEVTLPQSLKSIGREAFASCSNLLSLILPDGVESLGYRAFTNCSKLAEIHLPAAWKECPSYNTNTGRDYQGSLFYGCQKLLTITIPEGLTYIPDYALTNARYVQTIQLPAALTTLREYEFVDGHALKSITIPEGVTELPAYVFYNCKGLTEINLPQNLTAIGRHAFYNCTSLATMVLPDSVESLGYRLFQNCSKLTEVTLPAGWKYCPSTSSGYTGRSYQGNLFYGCSALKHVVLPQDLEYIPDYALAGCQNLQTVQLPAALKTLKTYEFADCTALLSITIPEGVTELPQYVFSSCKSLAEINLPDTLTSIAQYAFDNCQKLASVTIPEGITELPQYVFNNCKALAEVNLPDTVVSIGRQAFNNCSALETIVIPEGVVNLGYRAFAGCSKLSSVTLPLSWTECPSYNGNYTGYSYQGGLFYGCSSLKNLVLPEGMEVIPAYALAYANYLETVQLPSTLKSLRDYEFLNCQKLQSVTIPEGITELPSHVFGSCYALTEVNLPESMTAIGQFAFDNCSALETIVIPEGVESLGYRAFAGCSKLSSVTLPVSWTNCPSNNSNYGGSSYQGNLFYGCKALTELTLPEGMETIPDYAFYNCQYLQKVNLPTSMKSFGKQIFSYCSALQSIAVPEGVTELTAYQFSNCKALTQVTLPASLTKIGTEAFYNCSALEQIQLPAGIKIIEAGAFGNCGALKEITLPEGLEQLGARAFYNCKVLTQLTLPSSLTKIESETFYNCAALEQIQMPEGLERIGTYAFYNCKALTSIVIPNSVTVVDNKAFSGCTALANIELGPNTDVATNAFDSVVKEGTLGSLTWKLDMTTYTLTISGEGDMILPVDENGNPVRPWEHLRCLTRNLVIEKTVTSIDSGAFRGFTNLSHLDLSEGAMGIGAYSFADCTGLKSVILGENVRIVGEGAFSGCTSLSEVTILREEQIQFGDVALPDSSDVTVTYPETSTEYGSYFRDNLPAVNTETWDNTLPGRDVVLVLDVSGSMSGTRIANLKTAVKMFLDRVGGIATNSRVAIVAYDDSASVISGFSWNMEGLKEKVDSLVDGGGTQYLNALNSAESVLTGSDKDIRAMIFFTDGAPNDAQGPILSKCEALWKNYRIYTVGFQPSTSGEQLLIKMAGGPGNYYHSSNMDSLAEAFKSLSGGVGSEVEEEEYYDLTEKRLFTIKTVGVSYPAVIGFTITVGDKTYTSGLAADAKVLEERIEVYIPEDYTGKVVISREGYVTYEMPLNMVGNYNSVLMHPVGNGDPFVQQLLYVPVKDRQSYKNCFDRVSIEQAALGAPASTQRFFADIQWNKHKPGEVWLQQGSKKLTLTDGEFTDVAVKDTFTADGGPVYLYFRSADGLEKNVKTEISITPADNRLPLNMGESLSIPKKDVSKMKIFGERKLEVDFSAWTDVPISFSIGSDGTIEGTIGLRKDGKNLGGGVEGEGKTLKEAFKNLKKSSAMDDDELADMLDELTKKAEPCNSKFGLEGKAWLVGVFTGKINEDGSLEVKDVDAYLIAEAGISYTVPFNVMGVPLYFQAQLKAAIKSDLVLRQQQGTLLPAPDVMIDSNITISLGGGVGVEGVLSGGAQGDGTAGLEIMLMDSSATKAYVEAGFSLVGSLLGLRGKWELWHSDKYYFYKNGKFTWTKEMAAKAEATTFTLLPEPAHSSQFYPFGMDQQTGNTAYTTLKTDTTPFSEPQIATFADGTMLVTWVDAVSGRVGVDVHGVYYSYFNGASWTAPRMVQDDGTNDYGLSMTELNGQAYVMWHDYDMVFGQDLEEVSQAAEHINISVAKFDSVTGTMTAVKEFSAGGYDHQPQIASANGQIQLAWKCGLEEEEKMYLAVSQDGSTWGEPRQESASWYVSGDRQLPSDYNGDALNNTGELVLLEENGLRAIVYKGNDISGSQNVFAVYNVGSGWGKPIQITKFSGGTYVDNFGADLDSGSMVLVLNLTHANGKADLAYMERTLGTDLAVVRADYDHFTLVPGKSAVFYARVTNMGPDTEDMMKLRLVDGEGKVLKTQLSEAVVTSGDTVRLEMNYVVPADNSLENVSLVVLPVHGKDVDETNNSKSFAISYTDISVEEMSAYVTDTETVVMARIVNRGNVELGTCGYSLNYKTPDGQQVAKGNIPAIPVGDVYMLELSLDVLADNELLYLNVDELEGENLSSNNQGFANIRSVFSGKRVVESVALDRTYAALEAGQSVTLTASCEPSGEQSRIAWRVENPEGETVISLAPDGTVTAMNAGTAYAVAYVENEDTVVEARCRIDVTRSSVADEITGVTLGTAAVTAELYSTDYAAFDVLIALKQNMTASASTDYAPAPKGVAIESARFNNEEMEQFFDLVPADDRTLLVVPNANAIENAADVAKSYTGTVTVTVEGETFTTAGALKLTVKKSVPKVKVQVDPFNAFYTGHSQAVKVTGATVTKVLADTGVRENLPQWLTLDGNKLALTENAPRKASGKAYLEIWTEEWAVPISVAVNVKCGYTAPGLKLSASGVQLSDQPGNSAGVQLQLLPRNKKDTLSGLKVETVSAPAGYSIENYADGTFTLKAEHGFKPGKIELAVSFLDTEETLKLPVTVKAVPVSLKPSTANVTLNAEIGDSALVGITAAPADYILTEPGFRAVDGNGYDVLATGELEVTWENGAVKISTTAKTPAGANYTLYIKAGSGKEATVRIKTVGGKPTLALKQTANMDLTFDAPAIITTNFRNHAGGKVTDFAYTVDEFAGKELVGQNVPFFDVTGNDGKNFAVTCIAPDRVNVKNTYVLSLKLTLANGENYEAGIKLKIVRTAVKLKLSASKLTLNKKVGDVAAVAVTCTTKGYTLDQPFWQLMDKSGKQPMNGRLDIGWNDGELVIGTNKATEYGATYKLLIAAEEGAAQTTLTVTVPAEAKSNVTATLKVKGNLDVVRSNAVTVTPVYKGCLADTPRTEELLVVRSDNRIVTDQFDIVKNGDGTYTIAIAEGAQIDLTKKYQVQMESGIAAGIKPVQLKITMGTAKLNLVAEDTTLFAKDKNDRAAFRITSSDDALNGVAAVEIKDAKYRELFDVIDYGNGNFAVGFREGKADESIIGKSVTLNLNVFLEGNQSAKANATVKIKLTIVK